MTTSRPFVRAVILSLSISVSGISAPALAQSNLSMSFTTTPTGGNFAPKNIVAVWIEDSNGTFVKTIGRWAGTRRALLLGWVAKAGAADVDAVSGATRADHAGTLSVGWNLQNRAGAEVPDGTYTIRAELCDSNPTSVTKNLLGSFTFVKGPQSSTRNTSGSGFNAVAINYTAPGTGGSGGGTGGSGGSGGSGGGTGGSGGGTSGSGGGTGGSGGGMGAGGGAGGGGGTTPVAAGGCTSAGPGQGAIWMLGLALIRVGRRQSRNRS